MRHVSVDHESKTRICEDVCGCLILSVSVLLEADDRAWFEMNINGIIKL